MIPAWFRASRYEFRLRYLIFVAVYALGFTAPWDHWLHLDGLGGSVWLLSSAYLTRAFGLGLEAASVTVLAWGVVFSLLSALLRTWASAYLGEATVSAGPLQGAELVSGGPYRYLRNPLYIGLFFLTLALAILMPPSGAVFTLVLTVIFELRLIGAEKAFLERTQGAAYIVYRGLVPSLLPTLRPGVAKTGAKARWLQGFAGEIFEWGVLLAFVVTGWRYNAFLVTKWIVVAFGVSLVAKAALPGKRPQTVQE